MSYSAVLVSTVQQDESATHIPMHVYTVSCFGHLQLLETLWPVLRQAPLSVGFSRQEDWSGFPFPSPGYLPDPGIKLRQILYQLRQGYV